MLFQFLFQHILVHSFSCMYGTSSFDEEVPELSKCDVLLCRGGPVFSTLVSTNSNYFHFLHMWYLPRQTRRYQSCPNFLYLFGEDVLLVCFLLP